MTSSKKEAHKLFLKLRKEGKSEKEIIYEIRSLFVEKRLLGCKIKKDFGRQLIDGWIKRQERGKSKSKNR